MSWQAYVDEHLTGRRLADGAIMGHDGNVWASSPGLTIDSDEGQKICKAFEDGTDIRSSGIFISGKKFLAVRADDRSIYGKLGSGGCILVKTGRTVLIGIYGDDLQPGQAANAVEKLGDYLNEAGY